MKKAIFLDRDGVINKKPAEHEYVTRWEEMEILPGAKEAITLIKRSGYLAVVITNQRGVARGKMKAEAVHEIHKKLNKKFNNQIDGFYCCFHSEEEKCECRKPKPGLVHKAAEELQIDLASSWMIGDSVSDIECGLAAGAKVKLMETDADLAAEIRQIIGDGKNGPSRVELVSYGNKKTTRQSTGK
jgi:D-glycero-D-manno-heptose 1,7-bisphosphate phosphatase